MINRDKIIPTCLEWYNELNLSTSTSIFQCKDASKFIFKYNNNTCHVNSSFNIISLLEKIKNIFPHSRYALYKLSFLSMHHPSFHLLLKHSRSQRALTFVLIPISDYHIPNAFMMSLTLYYSLIFIKPSKEKPQWSNLFKSRISSWSIDFQPTTYASGLM